MEDVLFKFAEQFRKLVDQGADFAPQQLLEIVFRGRRGRIDLGIGEALDKPGSDPGCGMGLPWSVTGLRYCNRVIPYRYHHGLYIIGVLFLKLILTETDGIVLVISEIRFQAEVFLKR